MSAATALGASVARVGVARPRTSPRAASASASRRERAVGARGALLSGSSTAHPGLGVRRGATAAMLGRAGRMTGRGARSVTTMGLPIPIIGGLFNPAVMSIVYVFGESILIIVWAISLKACFVHSGHQILPRFQPHQLQWGQEGRDDRAVARPRGDEPVVPREPPTRHHGIGKIRWGVS